MSATDNGGPALPAAHFDLADGEHGMTLRDYFAAQALSGFCASPNATIEWLGKSCVVSCFQLADEMLKERAK